MEHFRPAGRLAALCDGDLQPWVRSEQGGHRVGVLGRPRLMAAIPAVAGKDQLGKLPGQVGVRPFLCLRLRLPVSS